MKCVILPYAQSKQPLGHKKQNVTDTHAQAEVDLILDKNNYSERNKTMVLGMKWELK